MMPRRTVDSLLADQLAGQHRTSELASSELRKCGTAELAGPGGGPAARPIPKYLRLERKDARLRADQLDELARLARRLQRARPRERITENTLLRIATDMLLAVADELAGRDEEELRAAALQFVTR